jgi:hypothetical protein
MKFKYSLGPYMDKMDCIKLKTYSITQYVNFKLKLKNPAA